MKAKRARLLQHRIRRTAVPQNTAEEPRASAASAGLLYMTDRVPGIRRVRVGKGFRYVAANGSTIRDASELGRIRSLVIPPAWEDVWICANSRGHLQATGRDARGRKQHRYHPRWRQVRDEAKYGHMLEFAASLPALRRQVEADVSAPGLSRRKVIAAVVQLLEKTLIRVGNDEYARDNKSFGLTTLQAGHARISGSTIRFRFRGKSAKFHDVTFSDARLARIVRKCQELPGRELFQYLDEDGKPQDIGSADVNDYVKEVTGQDFTAKDFRTWSGTVLAALALCEMRDFTSNAHAKRNILKAIDAVAGVLGNTRSVCRKCYIHPAIVDAYVDRTLAQTLSRRAARRTVRAAGSLSGAEAAVLALLQHRVRREAQRRSA
jgi:DNA topoisomerase-1